MFNLLSNIVNGVSQFLAGNKEIRQAKLDLKKAELENKARLMREENSHNSEWEMASLAGKDRWLQRFSFFMFSAPFIIALVAPDAVHQYFSVTLNVIPTFWKDCWVGITGSIWGISSLKNAIPTIVNSLKSRGKNV